MAVELNALAIGNRPAVRVKNPRERPFHRPLVVHILVALLAGETHAYALCRQMIDDAGPSLVIIERTIYRELPRLVRAGLVEIVNAPPARTRYRISAYGRRMLRLEQERIGQLYKVMRRRLV